MNDKEISPLVAEANKHPGIFNVAEVQEDGVNYQLFLIKFEGQQITGDPVMERIFGLRGEKT